MAEIEDKNMRMKDAKFVYSMSYSDEYDLEDLKQRRLYIDDEIDEDVIDRILYHIMRYNREDKGLPIESRQPIILYISTPGGDVVSGFGLIDGIINSITPVYTVNLAMEYSMGFLIGIAGHKRYAMPHSTFLLHDGQSFAYDSSAKLADRMDFESHQMEVKVKELVVSHTKISSDVYDEKRRVEWYMYPEEAKSNGVTDYIIGIDCKMEDIL